MDVFKRYREAVGYIDSLGNLPLFAEYMKPGKKPHPEIFLKRMRYFLKLLGNPERGFKFVHITGTAGKGTVATMVHNALTAEGKRSGLLTSPFVVSPIEKIQVGDLYIAPDEFAELVETIKPAIDLAYAAGRFGRPAHFELFFAVALLYFKKKKCEWVVLEVGCGGRYDATNIIPAPVASAITCIDYDHTEVLGNTLRKIAYDKAGIIKRGSKFLTTEKRPALLKIFEKICEERGITTPLIPLLLPPPRLADSALPLRQGEWEGKDFLPPNEALATTLCRTIGLPESAIRKGIRNTRLPARFEILSHQPLVIVDGAHNRAKIAYTVDALRRQKYQKLFLIIALADNKDSGDIFKKLVPLADEVFFTRFATRDRKPAPPARLLKDAKHYLKSGARTRIFLDSADALSEARRKAKKGDCILVTGSFFLAGEARKMWFPEEKILKSRRSF